MFGKPKKQVVGCDVGSSAIKIVELKPLKSGEFQLLHAAIADLSPEAIELPPILGAQHHILGEQTVLNGVLGRFGFALRSPGPCGLQRILVISR